MLADRLRTSAILIAVILGLFYLDARHSIPGAEGLWLLPLLLCFALGTAWDMASLLDAGGRPLSRRATLLATAMVTTSAAVPMAWPLTGSSYPSDCPVGHLGWIALATVAAVFLILLREMRNYGRPAEEQTEASADDRGAAITRACGATFVSVYVGIPMALLVAIRSMGDGNWGLAAIVTTIAVTKSADAGAYFAGKAIGKHKLIPRLSPGKTWEGGLGGILTATIVAFVCLRWVFPAVSGDAAGPVVRPTIDGLDHPFWGGMLLGPLLTLSGMAGDLAESLVKRDCGAKDSGNLLPGLGGVWDVTDSLIAAIVPAFLCFAAGVAA